MEEKLTKDVENLMVEVYQISQELKKDKVVKNVTENPDSLDIGTPSKGGAIKVYGDFSKPDEFKKKVDNAVAVRAYAVSQL